MFLEYNNLMRSGFHSQNSPTRNFPEHPLTANGNSRPLFHKPATLENSEIHHSNVFHQVPEVQSKKISTTIKGLGERIDGV